MADQQNLSNEEIEPVSYEPAGDIDQPPGSEPDDSPAPEHEMPKSDDDLDQPPDDIAAEDDVNPGSEAEKSDAEDSEQGEQPEKEPANVAPFTKVVIFIQESGTLISAQRSDTDPRWLATNDTQLEQALGMVPEFVRESEEIWGKKPRYNPFKQPESPPATPPRSSRARSQLPPDAPRLL